MTEPWEPSKSWQVVASRGDWKESTADNSDNSDRQIQSCRTGSIRFRFSNYSIRVAQQDAASKKHWSNVS